MQCPALNVCSASGMLVLPRPLGPGALRTHSHSPGTWSTNIFNTFRKGSHSPVPTLHALWTGFFFRMRIITKIMLYWDTVLHTLVDQESLEVGRVGEDGGHCSISLPLL